MDNDEDRIKTRAYALWEAEGKPDGRHDAHWEQAYREIAKGTDTAVLGEPDAEPEPSPAAAIPAEQKTPLSVIDGGAAGEPAAKRKRKTV